MARIKKNKMGYYMPNKEEMKAYQWCINHGIYISPYANGEGGWYIDIKLNGRNNRSPEVYGAVSIWIKLYEFYKYYYNKYAHKI
jgi:hypothetical protein|tara:strand:- start:176 stop:427 length:252 start_codon:yes stop_codon:yes gene_type:complete